jgi:hypothetical protein
MLNVSRAHGVPADLRRLRQRRRPHHLLHGFGLLSTAATAVATSTAALARATTASLTFATEARPAAATATWLRRGVPLVLSLPKPNHAGVRRVVPALYLPPWSLPVFALPLYGLASALAAAHADAVAAALADAASSAAASTHADSAAHEPGRQLPRALCLRLWRMRVLLWHMGRLLSSRCVFRTAPPDATPFTNIVAAATYINQSRPPARHYYPPPPPPHISTSAHGLYTGSTHTIVVPPPHTI